MRIGSNTGPVLLGEVGTTGEFTAMGDTVNLASRLEHAALVDGILISHATYRHVRGVFDVQGQDPLSVKGKREPLQTYVVHAAKPRAFRVGTRGIEGIETRMVGREADFQRLQNAFTAAVAHCATHLVTVIGEAGVGKSRLLYEFENWIELRPETITDFKGRTTPTLQRVPYSLVRDMFAYRFGILESDSPAEALEKFRLGMAEVLPPERADLVGHLIGFDFSASTAVRNLLGSTGFGELARVYLTTYLRELAARRFCGYGGVPFQACPAYLLKSLALSRETGSRQDEVFALTNLAVNLCRHITHTTNLGLPGSALGDYDTVKRYLYASLHVAADIATHPVILHSLAGIAVVWASTGQPQRALLLLGIADHHPALITRTQSGIIDPLLATLRRQLPPDIVEAGLARGRELDLEAVVAEILQDDDLQDLPL
jgi:hypothetical protein